MLPEIQAVRNHLLRITGVPWKVNPTAQMAWYESTAENSYLLEEIKAHFASYHVVLVSQRNKETKAPVLVYKPYDLSQLAQIPSVSKRRHPTETAVSINASYAPQIMMIDLHGLSEEEAKRKVVKYLSQADFHQKIFRIVTGRGNHSNNRGEKGTLYKKLPSWISSSELKDKIETVTPENGYYTVILKSEETLESTYRQFLSHPALQPFRAEMNINFEEKRTLARQGEANAQYFLGACYEKGFHVEKNLREAMTWYLAAAKQGLGPAQFQLGSLYWIGNGVRQDDAVAFKWISKAAEQNVPVALFNLGKFYQEGDYVKQNKELAFNFFQKAANVGYTEAKRLVSYCYLKGDGVKKDEKLAFQWCQEAANEGDLFSQFNLGTYYENGIGTEQDYPQAFEYYKKAALRGDYDGQFGLGRCYVLGIGTKKDPKKGEKWLNKAAANGHQNANMLLSQMAHHFQQPEKSSLHLKKAAASGSLLAKVLSLGQGETSQENLEKFMEETQLTPLSQLQELPVEPQLLLANLYLYEGGTKKQVKNIVKLLIPLAEEGNLDAIRKLAMFYTKSPLHRENPHMWRLGIQYYEKGALQKDRFCLTNLGMFYRDGVMGVQKNRFKTLNFFQQAAAQNCPIAHNELGEFYLERCAKPNPPKAYEHFEIAAKGCESINREEHLSLEERLFRQQTFPLAAYNLGKMCFLGARGVEGNLEKAIVWLKKASEVEHLKATEILSLSTTCEEKNIKETYSFCDRAVKLGSKNPHILFKLGAMCLIGQNKALLDIPKGLMYFEEAERVINEKKLRCATLTEDETRVLQEIDKIKKIKQEFPFFAALVPRVQEENIPLEAPFNETAVLSTLRHGP